MYTAKDRRRRMWAAHPGRLRPIRGPGLQPARALLPLLGSTLLLSGLGGVLRRRRRKSKLCHQLHLVVNQVVSPDQTAVDFEHLDELTFYLAAGGRNVAHRTLERAVVRATEHTLDGHVVALGEDVLRFDARVGKRVHEVLVVLLDGLRAFQFYVAWRGGLDVR